MRAVLKVLVVLAVAACGQTASNSGSAEAASAGGGGEAAWVAACVERYVAQSPQAQQWAPGSCAQEWQNVVAAGPIADALLSAAGGGAAPSAAQLGGGLEVTSNGRTIEISWSEVGGLIPYDVPSALAERGATVTMIGCSQVGAGEFQKYFSVTPSGGEDPFPLGIYERSAPTGDAWSFYNVSAELGAAVKTMAQLRSDGTEWATACAY
ncbi:MAG: hypothetical protein NW206_06500 [Hyphomonadaceae bacterium]|nr:hypothetical protein [Hyphomonadaceae bacterium]